VNCSRGRPHPHLASTFKATRAAQLSSPVRLRCPAVVGSILDRGHLGATRTSIRLAGTCAVAFHLDANPARAIIMSAGQHRALWVVGQLPRPFLHAHEDLVWSVLMILHFADSAVLLTLHEVGTDGRRPGHAATASAPQRWPVPWCSTPRTPPSESCRDRASVVEANPRLDCLAVLGVQPDPLSEANPFGRWRRRNGRDRARTRDPIECRPPT